MSTTDITPECELKDRELQELVVLGVTHKTAERMDSLSGLVLSESNRHEQLHELKEILDAEELVYVSTCNRVSVILIAHRPPNTLLKVLRNWFAAGNGRGSVPPAEQWIVLNGRKALDHLLMVASSVDSMVVGERQIFGQLKNAFKEAREMELTSAKLHFLFEQSVKVARQVYNSTSLSEGRLSVVSLVEERLARFCAERGSVRAVMVGAGDMIDKVGGYLLGCDGVSLTFVNRTVERSEELAQRYGGKARSLSAFLQEPQPFDVLITSTAAPHHLFGERFLKEAGNGHGRLLIDLAIPPDVDPAVAAMPGIELVNMESLRSESADHRAERESSVSEARRIIDEGAEAIIDRWKIRTINPAIGKLTRKYIQESMDQLNKLLETNLKQLADEEKEELSRWVSKLAKHWAVLHAAGVKETARSCCMKAVSAYLEGTGIKEFVS
jgi:glutamyl-tRNA reductase